MSLSGPCWDLYYLESFHTQNPRAFVPPALKFSSTPSSSPVPNHFGTNRWSVVEFGCIIYVRALLLFDVCDANNHPSFVTLRTRLQQRFYHFEPFFIAAFVVGIHGKYGHRPFHPKTGNQPTSCHDFPPSLLAAHDVVTAPGLRYRP